MLDPSSHIEAGSGTGWAGGCVHDAPRMSTLRACVLSRSGFASGAGVVTTSGFHSKSPKESLSIELSSATGGLVGPANRSGPAVLVVVSAASIPRAIKPPQVLLFIDDQSPDRTTPSPDKCTIMRRSLVVTRRRRSNSPQLPTVHSTVRTSRPPTRVLRTMPWIPAPSLSTSPGSVGTTAMIGTFPPVRVNAPLRPRRRLRFALLGACSILTRHRGVPRLKARTIARDDCQARSQSHPPSILP